MIQIVLAVRGVVQASIRVVQTVAQNAARVSIRVARVSTRVVRHEAEAVPAQVAFRVEAAAVPAPVLMVQQAVRRAARERYVASLRLPAEFAFAFLLLRALSV